MRNQFENNIRSLVRMIMNEDAKSLVGDYLWPDNRLSQVKKGIKSNIEPDTPREADLRRRLIGFIMNHRDRPIDQAAADDLLTIASDPNYAKTLPLYMKGTVFRGISVSESWFKRNFGISYEEIAASKPAPGWSPGGSSEVLRVIEIDGTLNPVNPVTSWSKSWEAAADFAMGGGASGSDFSVPLVYEVDTSTGNFIDLKKAYDLDSGFLGVRLWKRRNEEEVISVSPVKILRIHILGWKLRQPGEMMPHRIKAPGTGYDDVGEDYAGQRAVPRKHLDKQFDQMNVPDIE